MCESWVDMLSRIYCVAQIITVLSNPFYGGFFKHAGIWIFEERECTRARERRGAISPLFRTLSQARNHLRVLRISLDRFSYLPPQRVGFLRRFGMKTGIHLTHFGLESGMVFEGTTGVYERIYRFNSRGVRKKYKYAISRWVWMKNCAIIQLITALFLPKGQVWKLVRKMTFFGLQKGQVLENKEHPPPPHQEFPGVPPPYSARRGSFLFPSYLERSKGTPPGNELLKTNYIFLIKLYSSYHSL